MLEQRWQGLAIVAIQSSVNWLVICRRLEAMEFQERRTHSSYTSYALSLSLRPPTLINEFPGFNAVPYCGSDTLHLVLVTL